MVARSSPRVPLYTEPAIGWRLWSIVRDGAGGVALSSPIQSYVWRPMEPNRARCPRHFGKQLPGARCGCGLYAVSRLEYFRMAPGVATDLHVGVLGSVALWGRVIEHVSGYRALFGYPDRMRLVCERCLIGGRDGVPTRVVSMDEGRLVPVCETHATIGWRAPRGITPTRLQQMLLSTYAVDLLPVQTLHEAGFVTRPSSPTRLLDAARFEVRQARRSRPRLVAVVLLALVFLVFPALADLSLTGVREDPVAAPPSPSPTQIRIVDPLETPPPLRSVSKAPGNRLTFGVVCGNRIGGRVEIVGCGKLDAELIGVYDSPREPKRECERLGNAYSRKPRFSVCWLDATKGIGPAPEVLRLPGVRLWDLRR